MGAITVMLSDELQALVDGEVRYGGYADGQAYLQALLMDEHARRSRALDAALRGGLDSGRSGRTVRQVFDDALHRAAGA